MPRIAAASAVFLTVVTCIGFNTARYPVVWEMVAASGGLPQSREADEPAGSSQPSTLPQSASFTESRPEANSTAFWESSAQSAETRSWESATVKPISAYPSSAAYAAEPAEGSLSEPTEGAPIVVDDYAPIDSVAMRVPRASAGAAFDSFDPVAPGDFAGRPIAPERPDTSDAREGSLPGQTDATEETAASRAREPVEARASKKYASSPPLGTGLATSASYAGPGDASTSQKANAAWNDEPDSESALVPLKPLNTGQSRLFARDAETPSDSTAVAGAGVRKSTLNINRLPPVDAVSSAAGADHWPPRSGDSIPIYPTTSAR